MSEQPKEYIFACDCCDNKCKVTMYNSIPPDCGCLINSDIGAIWKSRPHPVPAQCPYSADDDMCLECKAHEERIARQAREDVLDHVVQIILDEKSTCEYKADTETERSSSFGWQARSECCEDLLAEIAALRDGGEQPAAPAHAADALDVLDELYKFVDGIDPDFIIRERITLMKATLRQRGRE